VLCIGSGFAGLAPSQAGAVRGRYAHSRRANRRCKPASSITRTPGAWLVLGTVDASKVVGQERINICIDIPGEWAYRACVSVRMPS